MKHERQLDEIVVNELRNEALNFTQIYELLLNLNRKISKTTVSRHLQKMESQGIVYKDGKTRRYNTKLYYLSPSAQQELRFGIFEGVKSKREVRKHYEEIENESLSNTEKNKKMYVLLLLQSASGSSRWSVVDKAEPGLSSRYNPRTRRYETIEQYELPGVTIGDIVGHKHEGLDHIFQHENFEESETENCIKILQEEFDLYDKIKPMYRENGEVGIEIIDDLLKEFFQMCGAIFAYVDIRISKTLVCKRGVRKGLLLDALKWFISFFGRDRLNSLYNRMERDLAQRIDLFKKGKNIMKIKKTKKKIISDYFSSFLFEIDRWDKLIIATYHYRVKCDKRYRHVSKKYLGKYDKYCNYVSSLPKKYSVLIDKLLEMVYPKFLRQYHQSNRRLLAFTNRLTSI